MAKTQDSTGVVAISIGILGIAAAAIAGVSFYIADRTAQRIEQQEAMERAEKAIDNLFRATNATTTPTVRAEPVQSHGDAARRAAKLAVAKQGLGELIIGTVDSDGKSWKITGTAVGKGDSVPISITVRCVKSGNFEASLSYKK